MINKSQYCGNCEHGTSEGILVCKAKVIHSNETCSSGYFMHYFRGSKQHLLLLFCLRTVPLEMKYEWVLELFFKLKELLQKSKQG